MICLNIVNISVNETFDAVEENIEPVNRNMDDRLGVREVNNSFVLLIISDECDNVSWKNGMIASDFNFNAVVASYYLKNSPAMKVMFNHKRSVKQGESVALNQIISVGERGQVRGWINHRDYTGFVYTDLFRKLSAEGGFTTAVDHYPNGKSAYGCFDMAGNSWDWTSSEIVATNGAERGKTVLAIRGGSWYANKNSCRTDYRGEGRRPQGRYSTVGFRLVAEIK